MLVCHLTAINNQEHFLLSVNSNDLPLPYLIDYMVELFTALFDTFPLSIILAQGNLSYVKILFSFSQLRRLFSMLYSALPVVESLFGPFVFTFMNEALDCRLTMIRLLPRVCSRQSQMLWKYNLSFGVLLHVCWGLSGLLVFFSLSLSGFLVIFVLSLRFYTPVLLCFAVLFCFIVDLTQRKLCSLQQTLQIA